MFSFNSKWINIKYGHIDNNNNNNNGIIHDKAYLNLNNMKLMFPTVQQAPKEGEPRDDCESSNKQTKKVKCGESKLITLSQFNSIIIVSSYLLIKTYL